MLTNRDITLLKKHFFTKQQGERLEKRVDRLEKRLDDFEQKVLASTEKILGILADVMKELQTIREEMTLIVYRQSEHSDQLDNHSIRIAKIEKHPKLIS